jgi:hypothetical protein
MPWTMPTGLLAEMTTTGKLRSISLGILFAGQTAGGALGFAISGPLVEATRYVPILNREVEVLRGKK